MGAYCLHVHLRSGVPQGSILGPIFLFLHMLPLWVIIPTHNLSFHCYADERHIYPPETLTEPLHSVQLQTAAVAI